MIKTILKLLLLLPAIVYSDILPTKVKTPGKTNPIITEQLICSSEFRTGMYRGVSKKTKRRVFSSYGITKDFNKYEIDHLIPLVLGGSNDESNLFPQNYDTEPLNARDKDSLEVKLRSLVCDGKISLSDAQKEISTDWIKTYNKYMIK